MRHDRSDEGAPLLGTIGAAFHAGGAGYTTPHRGGLGASGFLRTNPAENRRFVAIFAVRGYARLYHLPLHSE